MTLVDNLNKIAQISKTFFLVIVAVAICWRGTTFNDPVGTGIVPILMCLGTAVSLALLAFSMASQRVIGEHA